jgi:hypothetical protein
MMSRRCSVAEGCMQQSTIHLAAVKAMGLKLGHMGSLPEPASCLTPRIRMLSVSKIDKIDEQAKRETGR